MRLTGLAALTIAIAAAAAAAAQPSAVNATGDAAVDPSTRAFACVRTAARYWAPHRDIPVADLAEVAAALCIQEGDHDIARCHFGFNCTQSQRENAENMFRTMREMALVDLVALRAGTTVEQLPF